MSEEVIWFYRVGDEHGHLSNFSRHPIDLDGKVWATSEHYFQAQKFAGSEGEEQVRAASSAREAARLGRSRELRLREDWPDVRDDVMRRALRAKFTQHEDLRAALLATGDAVLVEHTENDSYWADGGDGSGRNRLGELLVELRGELRGQQAETESP